MKKFLFLTLAFAMISHRADAIGQPDNDELPDKIEVFHNPHRCVTALLGAVGVAGDATSISASSEFGLVVSGSVVLVSAFAFAKFKGYFPPHGRVP